MLLWRKYRKSVENAKAENVVTDILDFSITHVSERRKRYAEGMEKICSPLPMARRKLKKLCAGGGLANYLLLYRFARTPANRDAMRRETGRSETRRDETSFFCNFSRHDR